MSTDLPTAEEMLAKADLRLSIAHTALSDAADWLRSDWRPVGSSLTPEQAERRTRMLRAIAAAKNAINEGR